MGSEDKAYFGRQKQLEKTFTKVDQKIKACHNLHTWKMLFRSGVPDSHKRRLLLAYFDITPESAIRNYEVVKEQAGASFLSMCEVSRVA